MQQNTNNNVAEQNNKPTRKKHYWFRKLVKDVKRVRWPDSKTNAKNFIKILIFTLLFVVFVSLLTYGFTQLWNVLHI
ncbi:preprotein translocase subunit SecE [Mycoplasmopsis mustelae]|uniref:Preprotein translocase subunit SecE n=1 Tax=Mycoplasmopsis mustelae TaxID=171289 RepID=A0A4R7UE78_9BACT|nr:preprotein translocase subunit SecE [Mycoplasmopsis mustelae]TDV23057.1 preprotein translocase subunit SecE [Mycoplasmopsis mustelae]